jgi:hypothetical protein
LANVHVSQIQGGAILAGGWRKGDREISRIDLFCKVKNVGEGAVVSVMGPCDDTSVADKDQRVLVDFDSKGLVNVHVSLDILDIDSKGLVTIGECPRIPDPGW